MRHVVTTSTLVIALALGVTRCGSSSSPTSPTPTSTAPVITSVTPASPIVTTAAQTLTVAGSNFATGMTLAITSPSGGVATSTSAQMQSLTATSFQVSAILGTVGTFTFQITSSAGEKSNALAVQAQASAQAWTVEGTLLTDVTSGYPGRPIADVSAFRMRDGRWRLLFAAGGALRSATSADGLSPTMDAGSRSNDPCGAVRAVQLDDGRTRVFCSLPAFGIKSYISSDEGLTLTLENQVLITPTALGLAGVAIKAGARSALATLWFINDEASAALIAEFYRQLRDPAVSKAAALQRAQTKLLDDRVYEHPAYWSPFLLLNNWL